MKKIWQLIKQMAVAVVTGLVAWLLLDKKKSRQDIGTQMDVLEKYVEKETLIEAKAETKREEACERVRSTSAVELTNSYSGACDAIADGIERYRKRTELLRKGY